MGFSRMLTQAGLPPSHECQVQFNRTVLITVLESTGEISVPFMLAKRQPTITLWGMTTGVNIQLRTDGRFSNFTRGKAEIFWQCRG